MRTLRWVASLLVAGVFASCASPGTDTDTGTGTGTGASDPATWAVRAEAWQQARADIGSANPIHVMRFYADDASVDDHTWLTYHGPWPWVPSYMRLVMWGPPPSVNGLYLSTDGIVLDYEWSDVAWTIRFLEANDVAPSGITSSRMVAMNVLVLWFAYKWPRAE